MQQFRFSMDGRGVNDLDLDFSEVEWDFPLLHVDPVNDNLVGQMTAPKANQGFKS